ncbi:hypothetical protein Lal_00041939 [Lupinus albus]|nr:hypothetical protein Lal_00041939 [Lupinus albus]
MKLLECSRKLETVIHKFYNSPKVNIEIWVQRTGAIICSNVEIWVNCLNVPKAYKSKNLKLYETIVTLLMISLGTCFVGELLQATVKTHCFGVRLKSAWVDNDIYLNNLKRNGTKAKQ